MKKIGHFIR